MARQLDPLSAIIATDYASILYYSRQYDSAVKQCRSVLELDPDNDHARALMIPAYFQLGKYDEAIDLFNRGSGQGGRLWMLGLEGIRYSRLGHGEESRQALTELEQAANSRTDRIPHVAGGLFGHGAEGPRN